MKLGDKGDSHFGRDASEHLVHGLVSCCKGCKSFMMEMSRKKLGASAFFVGVVLSISRHYMRRNLV